MFKKIIMSKNNLINIFIALIPFSLIIGNLATNINILIICLLGIAIFKNRIFFIEDKICQTLIYLFFFYLIIITSINNFPKIAENYLYKEHIIKSFFYLRFLILFLIITKLVEENIFHIKYLFLTSTFFSSVLALDIFIQVIFEKDIFGYEIYLNRPSGFFGTENIAGGYLQKFALFSIFFMALNFKDRKKRDLFIFSLFLIFLFSIFLTANRMPTILFILSFVMYFLFNFSYKKILLIFFSVVFLFFLSLKIPQFQELNYKFKVFYKHSSSIFAKAPKLFFNNFNNEERLKFEGHEYLIHFNSGIQIWKQNKIFGQGLKSFRINCDYGFNVTCNTHPHNYFIELMVDTGIVGLIFIYLIFFLGLKKFLKCHSSKILNKDIKLISNVFFLIIFFEFFPLRSTGSFFTTNNSVVIFLILSLLLNVKKIKLN